MNLSKFKQKCELASKICAVAAAPAIVLSTAAAVILFPLAIILNIAAGNLREKFNLIVRNPVTLAFLLFFLLFLIGSTYSTGPITDVLIVLRKHAKYLLAVMLFPVFMEEKWRNYAILSFIGGILVMLVASYLRTHGYLSWGATGAVEIFKSSIDFNFLMAFAAYLSLFKIASASSRYRMAWIIIFILIVHTVLFRSMGRSGYFIFMALMLLFFEQKMGWRGLIIAGASVTLLFVLAFSFSSTFKGRINFIFNDIKVYQQNENTSVGLRMTFVKNGIKLIKAHPVFGAGTGSYVKEYSSIKPTPLDLNVITAPNPHNEYIYIGVQFGIVGLIVLLLFFSIPLWYSKFLPEKEKYIARGVIVSIMLGSLSNTCLSDITMRHFYIYFIALAFAALSTKIKKSSK
ncbi:MAG: O-antigen ligase family protein [Gammaproteobacteria bacterium]|nr:O-antigen ligase family protein [Gammaproteobacteria bacterium]